MDRAAERRARHRTGHAPARPRACVAEDGLPPYDKVPSGRVRLAVETTYGYPDKDSVRAEAKPGVLDKQIPRIIRDLQTCHDEQRRPQLVWEREQADRRAVEERRRAAERAEWDAAMRRAHPQVVDALRRATLTAALHAWRDARDIREICATLATASHTARIAGQDEIPPRTSIPGAPQGAN